MKVVSCVFAAVLVLFCALVLGWGVFRVYRNLNFNDFSLTMDLSIIPSHRKPLVRAPPSRDDNAKLRLAIDFRGGCVSLATASLAECLSPRHCYGTVEWLGLFVERVVPLSGHVPRY